MTSTWLYERQSLGIQPGLERMEGLLELLGEPHRAYDTVHVAGTNGKGSVATLLARTLNLSGYRTGLYTSPHVVEFAERIRVDGVPIAPADLAALLDTMRAKVPVLDEAGTPPTFFEIVTSMAFTHFASVPVAWAVVEAGMGGRTDATNVVHPELTVITNVSMEHTAFLGDDLAAIAREKAGIIEPGVPVVTAADGVARDVLRQTAADREAPIVVVGDDYLHRTVEGDLVVSNGEQRRRYKLALAGRHQFENATLVVAGCDALRAMGVAISDEAIETAMRETSLSGRLETFDDHGVVVVIDGAHNPAAMRSLVDSLRGSGAIFDLVVGFSSDKDWRTMLDQMLPLARKIWAVPIRSPRSLDPHELASHVADHLNPTPVDTFEEAYHRARAEGATDVLATGSMFLAGEARALVTGHDLSEVGGSQ